MKYFGDSGGWYLAVDDRKDRVSNTGEGLFSARLVLILFGFIVIVGTAIVTSMFSQQSNRLPWSAAAAPHAPVLPVPMSSNRGHVEPRTRRAT